MMLDMIIAIAGVVETFKKHEQQDEQEKKDQVLTKEEQKQNVGVLVKGKEK